MIVTTTQNEMGRDSGKSATPTTTTANHTASATSQPSALVHMRGGVPVTDSLTIAREFGRRHDNVMQSLDSLIDDGTINHLDFKAAEYSDAKGESRRMIELTERGALIGMPFIGGRNSRKGQVRLVDAFLALRDRSLQALQPRRDVARVDASPARRSTVADREELYAAAGRIVARCRVPFSVAYRALSDFAGATGFRAMSQGQICDAESFASRLLDSVATPGDWKRIQQNRVAIGRVDLQFTLFESGSLS